MIYLKQQHFRKIGPLHQVLYQVEHDYSSIPLKPFIPKVCCDTINRHMITSVSVVIACSYLFNYDKFKFCRCSTNSSYWWWIYCKIVCGCWLYWIGQTWFFLHEFNIINYIYHVAGNFDNDFPEYLVLWHMKGMFAVGINIIQDTLACLIVWYFDVFCGCNKCMSYKYICIKCFKYLWTWY